MMSFGLLYHFSRYSEFGVCFIAPAFLGEVRLEGGDVLESGCALWPRWAPCW